MSSPIAMHSLLHKITELNERRTPLDMLFEQQLAFVDDKSRRKILVCPRRAGKTMVTCVLLMEQALAYPGDDFAYIALTRSSAKRIVWKMFKELFYDFSILAKFGDTATEIHLDNGSNIVLYGADQEHWIRRIEGTKHRAVVIDEAGLHNPRILDSLIQESIGPTLVDLRGDLILIGRPGPHKRGIFFDGANGINKRWSAHRWAAEDNPYVSEQIAEEIEELRAVNPNVDNEPWFIRNYLGKWPDNDNEGLVYKYNPSRNIVKELPDDSDCHYVLGVDFGYVDNAAFCLGRYYDHAPHLDIVESFKRSGMWTDQVAEVIKEYVEDYPGLRVVADPSRLSTLEELRIRWKIPVINANKKDKRDRIMAANTDMIAGLVRFWNVDQQAALEEMKHLHVRHRPNGTWDEQPGASNDACDAFLYMHDYCYHYRYKDKECQPIPGTSAYWDKQEQVLIRGMERQLEEEDGYGYL